MSEIWKPVKTWEGHYEVSSLGRVRSLKGAASRTCTGSLYLKQHPDSKGYLRVKLSDRGRAVSAKVHQLVAGAFLWRNRPRLQVNHKDTNKKNNRPSNLEWCTCKENMRHAFAHGLVPRAKGAAHVRARAVEKYIASLDAWVEYDTISEASKITGISKTAIRNVCAYASHRSHGTYWGGKKASKTAGGFIWRYKNA